MKEYSENVYDSIDRRFVSRIYPFNYKENFKTYKGITDSEIDEMTEKCDIDCGRGNKADELRAVFMANFYSKIYR